MPWHGITDLAQTILQAFDAQYGRFLEVTSGARRFEQAGLARRPAGDENRITLYDHHVGLVVEQLRCIADGKVPTRISLLRVKGITRLLPDYPRQLRSFSTPFVPVI